MKCPNCGRENPGIRLFCSRCGELLPDSEAREQAPERAAEDDVKIYRRTKPQLESAPPVSNDPLGEETDFFARRERVRRLYEDDWPELTRREEPPVRAQKPMAERPAPERSPYARPQEDLRRPPTLNRNRPAPTGRPSTLIPRREPSLAPENLFSVRGEAPFGDEYDSPPRRPGPRRSPYEEAESQSFFVRHVRGIVGMILLAVTLTIVLTWAFTPNAQRVLARFDLAWSAPAYAALGTDAYDAGRYADAGRYFSAALQRDAANAGYAIYAANSFIQGGETGRAIGALKRLIALEPGNADYYATLMGLYEGYENLPEDARALIDEGYERTGDSRLKQ